VALVSQLKATSKEIEAPGRASREHLHDDGSVQLILAWPEGTDPVRRRTILAYQSVLKWPATQNNLIGRQACCLRSDNCSRALNDIYLVCHARIVRRPKDEDQSYLQGVVLPYLHDSAAKVSSGGGLRCRTHYGWPGRAMGPRNSSLVRIITTHQ